MANAGEVVKPGGRGRAPNPFQRFYRSQTFDLVCGAFPGLLLGIYSLFISVYSVYAATKEGMPDGLFALLLALSSFGAAACIALLLSTFARARLGPTWRTVCTVFLALGMLDALISLAVLGAMILPLGRRDAPQLLLPLALGISLSLAAFKQIRLLKAGGRSVLSR